MEHVLVRLWRCAGWQRNPPSPHAYPCSCSMLPFGPCKKITFRIYEASDEHMTSPVGVIQKVRVRSRLSAAAGARTLTPPPPTRGAGLEGLLLIRLGRGPVHDR